MVQRAVLDSNALDRVLDSPDLNVQVVAAVEADQVRLLYTHVTIDELAKIPDARMQRRADLLAWVTTFASPVPTGGFVLDVSRLDMGRIGDATGVIPYLQSAQGDHTLDALIGATAKYEAAYLLTYDKRLSNRAAAHGIAVCTWESLLEEIDTS
jgi:predicted nucleic acid-binding protein